MPSIILAGTTAGTALSLTSDTSGELQIRTNNGATTAMTLTTGGNVGIGTTSPANIGAGYSHLEVNGTTSGIISVSANGVRGFTASADGSQVNLQSRVNGQSMLFYTNCGSVTERMRIDSAGNVGIGNSTPASFSTKLVVSQAANVYGDERKVAVLIDTTALAAGVGAGISFFGTSESGGGTSQFGSIKGVKENATSGNYAGALAFVTSNSANVQTERMRVNSTGAVILQGGTTTANGIGITFPATQNASSDANTLDDYEEGSWTPNVGGTATYTLQQGRYVKIGSLVTVWFRLTINTIGTGGQANILGLPFACNALPDGQPGLSSYFANIATSVVELNWRIDNATNFLQPSGNTTAGNAMAFNFAVFQSGAQVIGSASYFSS